MSEVRAACEELAEARRSGGELATELMEAARGRMRRALRESFESDEVRKAFEESPDDPAPAVMSALAPHLAEGAEADVEAVVNELVAEAVDMRKGPPSLYLVDHSTGRALIPFGKSMVYQPPDYVNESGDRVRARPILHPGLTAPLMEAAHRSASEAAEALGGGRHTDHLSDPQSIVRHAREKLQSEGYVDAGPPDGPAMEARVGVESAVSANPSKAAWRARMYGAALASRVMAAARAAGAVRFQLGEAVRRHNSRSTWYDVTFRVV